MKVLIDKCIDGCYETKNPYDSKCNESGPCVLCPKFVHEVKP